MNYIKEIEDLVNICQKNKITSPVDKIIMSVSENNLEIY
jgi:hypothetical protein